MSVIQRFLYPGVVIASVAIHSIVLMLPMASSPETPPEEEEEVDIVQLAPLVQAPPKPPQASPRPTPSAAPAPRPVQQAAPRPQPAPVVAAAPSPPPSPAAPTPQETPAVPFDPSATQDQFFAGMQGIQGSIGVQPYPGAVDEPLAFFTSVENDGVPLPGIIGMQWFNDKKPDEIYPSLQSSYQGTLSFEPLGEYGGGPLYEAKTPTNDTAFFLNIISGRGGASTIVVTWDHNPNQPAPN